LFVKKNIGCIKLFKHLFDAEKEEEEMREKERDFENSCKLKK